jgi:hypothetical protein
MKAAALHSAVIVTAVLALGLSSTTRAEIFTGNQSQLVKIEKPFADVLRKQGRVGRLYFSSTSCTNALTDADPVKFPSLIISAFPADRVSTDGLADALKRNSNISLTEDSKKIIRMKIGQPNKKILQVKITQLKLSPEAQYNADQAIGAILGDITVSSTIKRLGFRSSNAPYIGASVDPSPKRPHLPEVLHDVTVDEALDEIAKTFSGIVRYGVCDDSHFFSISMDSFFAIDYSARHQQVLQTK